MHSANLPRERVPASVISVRRFQTRGERPTGHRAPTFPPRRKAVSSSCSGGSGAPPGLGVSRVRVTPTRRAGHEGLRRVGGPPRGQAPANPASEPPPGSPQSRRAPERRWPRTRPCSRMMQTGRCHARLPSRDVRGGVFAQGLIGDGTFEGPVPVSGGGRRLRWPMGIQLSRRPPGWTVPGPCAHVILTQGLGGVTAAGRSGPVAPRDRPGREQGGSG